MRTITTQSHRDYASLAKDYDDIRFSGTGGTFLERMDADIIRDFVARTGARTIVDIPTGTGRVASYVQPLGTDVIGCDLTPAMLELAKAKRLPNQIAFHDCDAKSLPFASHSVDCIVSLRFFHLFRWTDRPQFVQEFQRVLKPGGFVVCSFTNGFYGGGINWLKKALGYRTVHFEMPGEVRSLFPGWTVVAARGNFLPGQRFLTSLGPGTLVPFSQMLTAHWPLNRLCWERYLLLQAPKTNR